MSSSTVGRWQTERKSDLPKVTQQVSREAREGIQAFCVQNLAFPQPKRLSIHGESRLLYFKAVAPEFRTEAYVLQKRNTKLSSVSPHFKDLWAESLSLTAIQGEERRKIMQYLSFNSGNEPMGLKMGVVGGGAHQNHMRNFFNIYFSLRRDFDKWTKLTA